MNSLRRLLMVFDLFRPEQSVIDVDIITHGTYRRAIGSPTRMPGY